MTDIRQQMLNFQRMLKLRPDFKSLRPITQLITNGAGNAFCVRVNRPTGRT
jgi:hypothetical protein